MGNNYLLDLPPVLDGDNQPLTVEQSEQSLRIPWPVQVVIERSGKVTTYTVLCDFNNVDGAALDALELFKAQSYATIAQSRRRNTRNGKFTHLKTEDGDEEPTQPSGETAIATAKMRLTERRTFLDLLYPPDWEENPVVLASNLPDMPTEPSERKIWFERGGILATEVMEAVVMQIDPTGPLAERKQSEIKAREMESQMTKVLEEKLAEIQQMSLRPPPPSPETEQMPSDSSDESFSSPSVEAGDGASSGDLSSSLTETP